MSVIKLRNITKARISEKSVPLRKKNYGHEKFAIRDPVI
jgi:hypothetical protein